MAISNGFDEAKVLAALRGRIGWKQPFNPEYAIVDNDNQATASGRYYNDFHHSVTIPNIKELQEYAGISNADFNKLLSSLSDSNILSVVNAVFCQPQLVDQPEFMYERSDRTTPQTVALTDTFNGYRLSVVDTGYMAQLHMVRLLFDTDKAFKLYVFKENKPNPVYTADVAVTAGDVTEIVLNNFLLSGGRYFVGYFVSDLGTAKPIEYSSCFKSYHIVGIDSISVPKSGATSIATDQFQDRGSVTHGINLEISSYKEYTNKIVRSANFFDELQGLSMCINVMEMIYYSNRSNGVQLMAQDKEMELKSDMERFPTKEFPMSPGLKSKYKRELERVRLLFFKKAKAKATLPTDYDLYESSTDWNRRTYPKGTTDFIRKPADPMGS